MFQQHQLKSEPYRFMTHNAYKLPINVEPYLCTWQFFIKTSNRSRYEIEKTQKRTFYFHVGILTEEMAYDDAELTNVVNALFKPICVRTHDLEVHGIM